MNRRLGLWSLVALVVAGVAGMFVPRLVGGDGESDKAGAEVVAELDFSNVDDHDVVPTDEPIEVDEDATAFSSTVLPILEGRCAACHNEGGPGTAVWTLNTVADAATIAPDIALVTSARYMPPWPASDMSVAFHGSRALTDDQISAIASWADLGAPVDVDPDRAVEYTGPPPLALDRDTVVRAEPYAGSVEVEDDYRCQVFDPQLAETKWLHRFSFEPDQTEIVHHAVVFKLDRALRPLANQLDAREDGPGWECFGLAGIDGEIQQILGWAPGQDRTAYPDGTGVRFAKGDFLVVQIHYHYDDVTPVDRSAMVLDWADETSRELTPVEVRTYLAPAEIPCLAADADAELCDRNVAVAESPERGLRGTLANGLNLLCGTTPADYAGMTDGVASASCDHRVEPGGEGEVVAVFGHMHEIGQAFRMTLNPDTDEELVILDIPVWWFEWQLNFHPVEPVTIEEGDVLRIECTWDRAREPDREPEYVFWGEGTADEMCYSSLATVPHGTV